MSHQVLARKWRPRDFASLVGQDHVVRALTHALDHQRLHHAYLLTGTRGVGKTTIARILAKAVNCEVGLSATPCGVCSACTSIDTGRFVDYLELDAASNRGVDDMTQLLENAIYAPTQGRYKVYVIDEVHMLSSHAFNAMLKTLEEPPGHALFILATTDPQKVPVTVLSRCMQFNLKNMAPGRIAEHLARVLEAEKIGFEPAALSLIGQAASGSMRDALSLTDQAIAFGAGQLQEAAVRDMLGVVDQRFIERLVQALIGQDAAGLVALANEMQALNIGFERALGDLARAFQQAALIQAKAWAADAEVRPAVSLPVLEDLAGAVSAERLQVYYQVALHGLRDLPLAYDEASGFTMVLLRLLAFAPKGAALAGSPTQVVTGAAAETPSRASASRLAPSRPLQATSALRGVVVPAPAAPSVAREKAEPPEAPAAPPEPSVLAPRSPFDGQWLSLVAAMPQQGMLGQWFRQSELVGYESDAHGLMMRVRVPVRPFTEPGLLAKVKDALRSHFGLAVRLEVTLGEVAQTAQAAEQQAKTDRLEAARQALDQDPAVQALLADFEGRIVPESVRPSEPQ